MILSCPSYITPGTYLENVRFLDNQKNISNIELLFFLYNEETEKLFIEEKAQIQTFLGRFSFSVHMPDNLRAEHERIVKNTGELADLYVLHPPETERDGFFRIYRAWKEKYPDKVFIVENLVDRTLTGKEILEYDIPLCLDTGHLLLAGLKPAAYFIRFKKNIREIHLHGMREGGDHGPLSGKDTWLVELAPLLREFRGVCIIEVFNLPDLVRSLETLESFSIL